MYRNCATVNKEIYINIPRGRRDAVRRKRSEKWRTNSWFLMHDNAPAHRSVSVKYAYFLVNNATTLGPTPYNPDLAQDKFFLFPQLK